MQKMLPVFSAARVLVCWLALAGTSAAQESEDPPEESPENHDGMPHDGVFLRLTAGFGGAAASNQDTDSDFNGSAGFFSIDLGGTVGERLALHGRFSQHAMGDPTLSVGGTERGELDDTLVGFTLLGFGLTYYLPSDLYLTAVLGASVASVDTPEYELQSETGWGGAFDVGSEWHVGGDWGLGVAGRFETHSVPTGDDDDARFVGVASGVIVSATVH